MVLKGESGGMFAEVVIANFKVYRFPSSSTFLVSLLHNTHVAYVCAADIINNSEG
jgi:hypothetical protein